MFAVAEFYGVDNARLIACNNAFVEELGYTKEEILSVAPYNIYAPECIEEVRNFRRILLDEGKIKDVQIVLERKNGERIITSFNGIAEKLDNDVTRVRGTWRNISELIEARNKLSALNEALIRQDEDTKTFIHLLSHDMQSPIRGIDNLAVWLLEECSHLLPEQSLNNLKTLKGRTKRLENLVSDVLIYLQDGIADQVEKTCLEDITNYIMQRFCIRPSIKLRLYDQIGLFYTDKTLLSHVLNNLISNAIKHHHQPDNIHIDIYCCSETDFYKFKVKDNGPGIDKKFHSYIFEPLKQLKPKGQVEGSGLGLTIVRKIIHAKTGSIRIESEKGEGTSVIFTWPKKIQTSLKEEKSLL